jgi:hypothetical protein
MAWKYKYDSLAEFSEEFQNSVPIWWEGGRIETFRINSSDPLSQEYISLSSLNPGMRIKNLANYSFSQDEFLTTWFSKEVPGINLYLSESPGDRNTSTWDLLPSSSKDFYTETANNLIAKNFFSIQWPQETTLDSVIYRYHGKSDLPMVDLETIKSTFVPVGTPSYEGIYEFAAGGYKYFVWPEDWGSPIPIVGFRDTYNMMPIAMATDLDAPEFTNVENGWSFAKIDLPDYLGQNISYRLYRTRNILGGTLSVTVK